LGRANHILATSQITADLVDRMTNHIPQVVAPPVDPALTEFAHRSQGRLSNSRLAPAWPYLLTVAGTNWQDGRADAIAAWVNLRRTRSLDGVSLIVVGPPLTNAEEDQVATAGGHLQVMTSVSDEQLSALYARSRGVLSLGKPGRFSWSVAEAHAHGRPVLATDTGSYTQVGADGCVYLPVDLMDDFDLATWSAVAEDLSSPVLALRAQANADRFSWHRFLTAMSTVAGPVPGQVPAPVTAPQRTGFAPSLTAVGSNRATPAFGAIPATTGSMPRISQIPAAAASPTVSRQRERVG
jgi:glycosyltransferase involved in cell wall biosynthesis